MAHFYGYVRGAKGEASRLGHKSTGLETVAASNNGCVTVKLSEHDGVDHATVSLDKWQGSGNHVELYSGPVSGTGLKVRDLTVSDMVRDARADGYAVEQRESGKWHILVPVAEWPLGPFPSESAAWEAAGCYHRMRHLAA